MRRSRFELPEDPDQLAAWLVQQHEPAALDAALRGLEPAIRQRARLAALRHGLPAEEFADESFSHVALQLHLRQIDLTPPRRFRPWLNQVLKHLAINALRRRRRGEVQDPLVDTPGQTGRRASELLADPAADEQRLDAVLELRDWWSLLRERWPQTTAWDPPMQTEVQAWPPPRVVLLAISSLWNRLPD